YLTRKNHHAMTRETYVERIGNVAQLTSVALFTHSGGVKTINSVEIFLLTTTMVMV
ncbi:unnamed protein product, partial [Candidula unifasciata]